MSDRILFVLKYRENPYSWESKGTKYSTTLHSGLYNSARFVQEMLAKQGYETKLVHVKDNNGIHKEIVDFGATHVIIEAFWVVPTKFEDLYKACPNVKFIIRNHSEMPFLSNEGIGIEWALEYLKYQNVYMASNSPRATEELRRLVAAKYGRWWNSDYVKELLPYLPNYYPLPEKDKKNLKSVAPGDNFLDIGCFGAIRPLKNQLSQAIAAIALAEKLNRPLRFHINASRIEMNGSPILKNLRALFTNYTKHSLEEHSWLNHKDFLGLVSGMDLVTQCSFSETFCIVAADAVALGVPVVTSPEVFWSAKITQANPTDTNSITNAMECALNLKSWGFNFSLNGLKKYNKESVRLWTSYFKK